MSFFPLSLAGEFFVRVLSNDFNTELRREVSILSPKNVRNSARLGPTNPGSPACSCVHFIQVSV